MIVSLTGISSNSLLDALVFDLDIARVANELSENEASENPNSENVVDFWSVDFCRGVCVCFFIVFNSMFFLLFFFLKKIIKKTNKKVKIRTEGVIIDAKIIGVENVVDDTLAVDINVVGTVVDGMMYWALVLNLSKFRLKIYKHFYVSYDLFKFKKNKWNSSVKTW